MIGAQVPAHIVESARAVDGTLAESEADRTAAVAARAPAFYAGGETEIRVRAGEGG